MYDHERQPDVEGKPFSCMYPPITPRFWPLMQHYLEERGLNPNIAIQNGWYPTDGAGDLYPRVVIPAFSYQEGNRYWQARDMCHRAPLRYQSPRGVKRGDAFVRVVPPHDVEGVVIAEGPMDALAAADCGFVGIGLMGVTPSPEVFGAVARFLAAVTHAESRVQAARGSRSPSNEGTGILVCPAESEGSTGRVGVVVVSDEGALGAATRIWAHFPGACLISTYPWKDIACVPLAERKVLLR